MRDSNNGEWPRLNLSESVLRTRTACSGLVWMDEARLFTWFSACFVFVFIVFIFVLFCSARPHARCGSNDLLALFCEAFVFVIVKTSLTF